MARILVIEDTRSLRMLYAQELQLDGHTVLTAGNADQGLALLGLDVVDLVVLDLRLPGMDGSGALHYIRATQPGLPVILNSAYERPPDGVMAEAYIVKSSDTAELRAAIQELLRARHRRGRRSTAAPRRSPIRVRKECERDE